MALSLLVWLLHHSVTEPGLPAWLLLHLFVRRGFDIYLQLTLGFIINSTGEWRDGQMEEQTDSGSGLRE